VDLAQKINWNAVRLAAEVRPQSFEEALLLKGLGPAAFRGLSLVSALVYGTPPSFRDPVKYSFAFGARMACPIREPPGHGGDRAGHAPGHFTRPLGQQR